MPTHSVDFPRAINDTGYREEMTTTETEEIKKRPIRSFVLRQGRLTPAQQRALDTGMPQFGVTYSAQPLNLNQLFGRADSLKILEIGFGMGETTAHIAQSHPEWDFLGIEVHTPGVGSLLKQVGEVRTNLYAGRPRVVLAAKLFAAGSKLLASGKRGGT